MDMLCVEHGTGGDRHGYGRVRHGGKTELMHRVEYVKHAGKTLEDIRGVEIRHLCNNPRCVNPLHLAEGTHRENMQDMVDAGRSYPGATNVNAKLTDALAATIRAEYVPRCREHGTRALARKYLVAHTTISKIVRGVSY